MPAITGCISSSVKIEITEVQRVQEDQGEDQDSSELGKLLRSKKFCIDQVKRQVLPFIDDIFKDNIKPCRKQ